MGTKRKIAHLGYQSMYLVGTLSFILTIIVTYLSVIPQLAFSQFAAKKHA